MSVILNFKITQHKILLFSFMILALLGVIFNNYQYTRIIALYGFITFSSVTFFFVKNLVKYQEFLGISIFLLGSLFWFWKEIITMSVSPILFENVASYSPFFTEQIPIEILSISLFSFSIFNFFVYFFWSIFMLFRFPVKLFLIKSTSKNNFFIEILIMLFAFSGWIPFSSEFGGLIEIFESLVLFREEEIEFQSSLINYLPVLAIMAGSFAMFRITLNISKFRFLSILAIISGGLIAFLSGTRFKILFLILPSILGILMNNKINFTFKKKTFFVIGISSILIATSFFQVFNRYGDYSRENTTNNVISSANGSDHFTPLTHAVSISSELDSYFYQPMITLFMSDFVPRMYWPSKPDSKFWEFYNDKLSIAGNVTPSVLGQYFLNWGVFGAIIAGFNFGLWCCVCDFLIRNYKTTNNYFYLWLATVLMSFIFLSFRVYSFNYFFYLLIAYFFGWFFTKSHKLI